MAHDGETVRHTHVQLERLADIATLIMRDPGPGCAIVVRTDAHEPDEFAFGGRFWTIPTTSAAP